MLVIRIRTENRYISRRPKCAAVTADPVLHTTAPTSFVAATNAIGLRTLRE